MNIIPVFVLVTTAYLLGGCMGEDKQSLWMGKPPGKGSYCSSLTYTPLYHVSVFDSRSNELKCVFKDEMRYWDTNECTIKFTFYPENELLADIHVSMPGYQSETQYGVFNRYDVNPCGSDFEEFTTEVEFRLVPEQAL